MSCSSGKLQREREHGTKAKCWFSELFAKVLAGRQDESTLVCGGMGEKDWIGVGSCFAFHYVALRCVMHWDCLALGYGVGPASARRRIVGLGFWAGVHSLR